MTAEEYEEECNEVIMEYFQAEERIIAKAKKDGIWSRDLPANDYLFHDIAEKMNERLSQIRKNYYLNSQALR